MGKGCLPVRLSLFHETAFFYAIASENRGCATDGLDFKGRYRRTNLASPVIQRWLVACALMRRKSAGGPKTLVETEALSLCTACKGIALRNIFLPARRRLIRKQKAKRWYNLLNRSDPEKRWIEAPNHGFR